MTEADFITYMKGLIDKNDNRNITGIILQTVLTVFSQNVVWKNKLPFDISDPIEIENGDLNINLEYIIKHGLDTDDPFYLVRGVDNQPIRGDEYFTIDPIDSNSEKFTFIDSIPPGTVKIIALKFKAAS